jgi:transposase-like protein
MRIVRPMVGFKSIRCARRALASIETMRMIRNGHLNCPEGDASSAPNQIYSPTS